MMMTDKESLNERVYLKKLVSLLALKRSHPDKGPTDAVGCIGRGMYMYDATGVNSPPPATRREWQFTGISCFLNGNVTQITTINLPPPPYSSRVEEILFDILFI